MTSTRVTTVAKTEKRHTVTNVSSDERGGIKKERGKRGEGTSGLTSTWFRQVRPDVVQKRWLAVVTMPVRNQVYRRRRRGVHRCTTRL